MRKESPAQVVGPPHREDAVVRPGEHPVEHERPEDWGWHGETGKKGRIGAWIAAVVILTFLIGNHTGRVEDLWVLGIVGVMVAILVRDIFRRRNAWRSR